MIDREIDHSDTGLANWLEERLNKNLPCDYWNNNELVELLKQLRKDANKGVLFHEH